MLEKLSKIDQCFYCTICGKKKTSCIRKKELNNISNDWFKMNEIINKFLLTGDKFMPELHLKHSGFTYSACGSIQNLQKQRI